MRTTLTSVLEVSGPFSFHSERISSILAMNLFRQIEWFSFNLQIFASLAVPFPVRGSGIINDFEDVLFLKHRAPAFTASLFNSPYFFHCCHCLRKLDKSKRRKKTMFVCIYCLASQVNYKNRNYTEKNQQWSEMWRLTTMIRGQFTLHKVNEWLSRACPRTRSNGSNSIGNHVCIGYLSTHRSFLMNDRDAWVQQPSPVSCEYQRRVDSSTMIVQKDKKQSFNVSHLQ